MVKQQFAYLTPEKSGSGKLILVVLFLLIVGYAVAIFVTRQNAEACSGTVENECSFGRFCAVNDDEFTGKCVLAVDVLARM